MDGERCWWRESVGRATGKGEGDGSTLTLLPLSASSSEAMQSDAMAFVQVLTLSSGSALAPSPAPPPRSCTDPNGRSLRWGDAASPGVESFNVLCWGSRRLEVPCCC